MRRVQASLLIQNPQGFLEVAAMGTPGWTLARGEAGARSHASAPALPVCSLAAGQLPLLSQAQSEVQKDLSGALLSSQGVGLSPRPG